jgi:hypothetical protein
VTLSSGTTNLTVDAGLYLPATLKGYVFKDRNADLIRDAGDGTLTNVLVRLKVNGVVVASTNTDVYGYYSFEKVPVGTVSILVSRASATLISVPTDGNAATDERRNRAIADDTGQDAVIVFDVISGYGVLEDLPSQTLNFGFSSYPLSTAMDISLFATGNGGVMIELWTVNESGYDDIVIYAWINNAWVEVGRVLSEDVWGEGSNRYTVQANGLAAGESYFIKIIDEAGHTHLSDQPVAVKTLRVEAVRLDLQTLALTFNTEAGYAYEVLVSTDLAHWTTEYVSYPTAAGMSAYLNTPFTAAGETTQVLVPLNGRKQAFFKIVRTD